MSSRRSELTRQAARLFAEKGYHGTSVGDLAEALGVQKGSLYAHIESKADLLWEVAREGGAAFHAALDSVPEEGPVVERIRAALDELPAGKTPTKRDWERLSSSWRRELDERIATLEAIRGRLTTCIGCGCLSLKTCGLLNPDDEAGRLGGGAHYLRRVSPHGRDLEQRAQ